MYKKTNGKIKVLIGHHGGPLYENKDDGCWDIPKGEVEKEEELFSAAKREFWEETGIIPPENKEDYIYLSSFKRKDGKELFFWAFEREWNEELKGESYVEMEWPLKSGKRIRFPEIDRALFVDIDYARKKVWPSLLTFFDRLEDKIK